MKRCPMRFALISALILTAAACHSAAPDRLAPEAPYPDAGSGISRTQSSGDLVVYTTTYPSREASRAYMSGSDQPAWRVYSGYTVYGADGKRIGYIRNH